MSDLKTIEQILYEVQTISESYDRVAEATGENFNIFSVLKIETDEVTTHSRFIAELLNPKGAHGQKDRFLKIFMNILYGKKFLAKDPEKFELSDCKVLKEEKIGFIDTINETGGNIDLLINTNHFKIVIENKIDGVDQYKQLIRYHNFLNAKKNDKEKTLLYLTLDGHNPDSDSIRSDDGQMLEAEEDFYCVSYENLIIEWLEECKKTAVDIPILRESITQYINLIKKLTNQNPNNKMSKEVAKRVLRDQNSFKAYKALLQADKEIFNEVINNTIFPLLKDIKEKYNLELKLKDDFLSGDAHKGFKFRNNSLKNNNLELFFDFEAKDHNRLIFGFKYLKNDKVEKYLKIREKFKHQFGSLKPTDNSPCFNRYLGYQNWRNPKILEKIQFGDFKKDFEYKIQKMLAML